MAAALIAADSGQIAACLRDDAVWLGYAERLEGPSVIAAHLASRPPHALEIEQHGAHAVLRQRDGAALVIEVRGEHVIFGADASR